MQAEGEAQQQVEDAAEELAVQGLALRLGFGRSQREPMAMSAPSSSACEKFGGLFDGGGEVGVAK